MAGHLGRLTVASEEARARPESPPSASSHSSTSPAAGTSGNDTESSSSPPIGIGRVARRGIGQAIARDQPEMYSIDRAQAIGRSQPESDDIIDRDVLLHDEFYERTSALLRAHSMLPLAPATAATSSSPVPPRRLPMDDDPYFHGDVSAPAVISILQSLLNVSTNLKVNASFFVVTINSLCHTILGARH